jgi:hypothetical protein
MSKGSTGLFAVHFGPTFVLFKADTIGELKKQFASGEAESVVWRYQLREHELEITDEYLGHDLAVVKEKHSANILPDHHEPKSNGQTVYLVSTPTVDFEAHREMLHAEIRADNAARKAKAEAEAEENAAKEAAKAAAKKVPQAPAA